MSDRAQLRWALLETLRDGEAFSRPQIAEHLGISLPTAGAIAGELIAEGILIDAGHSPSTGGRPAATVRLNKDFAQSVGLAVSRREIVGTLVDIGGQVLARVGGPTRGNFDFRRVVEQITETAKTLLNHELAQRHAGIGVGISGIVDSGAGVSIQFPYVPDWRDVRLAELLSQRFHLPVVVWNDVQAAAQAEIRHGAGRLSDDFLYLHVGKGIGLGIVANGVLLRGHLGHAGELGHTVVDPNGPICHCGNFGCLESVASPPAIVAGAIDALTRGVQSSILSRAGGRTEAITIATILEAARENDRLAVNLLNTAGDHLGQALANTANIFNPELVVLGGILAGDREGLAGASVLADRIMRKLNHTILPVLAGKTRVLISPLGTLAAPIGAATIVIDQMLARLAAEETDDQKTPATLAHDSN
jgi:N-acetylglucosamine repressor